MEGNSDMHQEPYQDSPTASRSSTPTQTPNSPTKLHSTSSHNFAERQYEQGTLEPYRDEPSNDSNNPLFASPRPRRHHRRPPKIFIPHTTPQTSYPPPQNISPYSDNPLPTTHDHPNDEHVPLGHLYLYQYPAEAPPSYDVVVRESFRATLISHIHPTANGFASPTGTDEEAGERARPDDVRFRVEGMVAGLVVSLALLSVAALVTLTTLGKAGS